MKTHRTARLFTMLALVALFLAACQPAALEATSSPTEPAGLATQPSEVETEAPAPLPSATTASVETATPVEPTEAVSTVAPTDEGYAPTSTGMQVPKGWGTLYDAFQNYSLAYPPEWGVCEEFRYSRVFCEFQEEPAGVGPPVRLYVSVLPQEYTNPDGQVYNFFPIESIREFMALPEGESQVKVPDAFPAESFTYTRLPDRMVAGRTALVIENSTVWEAPSGTKDRVVFIVTEGTTYILGMYYETPEQLAMFEQVLDSFQFSP